MEKYPQQIITNSKIIHLTNQQQNNCMKKKSRRREWKYKQQSYEECVQFTFYKIYVQRINSNVSIECRI